MASWPGRPTACCWPDVWVVENFANMFGEPARVRLVQRHITSRINSALFDVPTTVAKHGDRLALVNARFDLGLPPLFGQAHRRVGPSTSSWYAR